MKSTLIFISILVALYLISEYIKKYTALNTGSESLGNYQLIRKADVFLLGPSMMYAGTFTALPPWLALFLFVSGIFTIWFNGRNYLLIEQEKEQNLLTYKI